MPQFQGGVNIPSAVGRNTRLGIDNKIYYIYLLLGIIDN